MRARTRSIGRQGVPLAACVANASDSLMRHACTRALVALSVIGDGATCTAAQPNPTQRTHQRASMCRNAKIMKLSCKNPQDFIISHPPQPRGRAKFICTRAHRRHKRLTQRNIPASPVAAAAATRLCIASTRIPLAVVVDAVGMTLGLARR
jgi:hypothetical protein